MSHFRREALLTALSPVLEPVCAKAGTGPAASGMEQVVANSSTGSQDAVIKLHIDKWLADPGVRATHTEFRDRIRDMNQETSQMASSTPALPKAHTCKMRPVCCPYRSEASHRRGPPCRVAQKPHSTGSTVALTRAAPSPRCSWGRTFGRRSALASRSTIET